MKPMNGAIAKLFLMFCAIQMCSHLRAQSDIMVIPSVHGTSGTFLEIPVFFQDISGSGVDSGIQNIGSFAIRATIPPSMIESISFYKAGVISDHPVLLEADLSEVSTGLVAWYVALNFGNVPVLELDPTPPGQLIAILKVELSDTIEYGYFDFLVDPAQTFIQDEFGNITNSVENNGLILDAGRVFIHQGSSCFLNLQLWPYETSILSLLGQDNYCFPDW